jgi:cbb3-type cytochrome oxidase subunit 3
VSAVNPVVVQASWTALSAAIFAGIVVWACSRGAKRDFGEAERLPFAEDEIADASAHRPEEGAR